MSKVDLEIYLNQLVKFFEKNPNELKTLIGDLDKEKFYERLKNSVHKNYEEFGDGVLTQQQIIDIVVDMFSQKKEEYTVHELKGVFMNHKYGLISLN